MILISIRKFCLFWKFVLLAFLNQKVHAKAFLGTESRDQHRNEDLDSNLHEGSRSQCGTPDLTPEEMEAAEARSNDYLKRMTGGSNFDLLTTNNTIDVDTYFHVIHDGERGLFSQDEVNESIDFVNSNFESSGSNYRFNLIETTFTDNADWFSLDGADDEQIFVMSEALRRGDCSTANVFSASFGGSLNGFIRYFPSWVWNNCTGPWIDDGIWIDYETAPLGTTLTHEFGHFMGVFHTFQGGCGPPGDLVDDTPPQDEPTRGCPSPAPDTCRDDDFPDPINNFMDYSQCRTEFTPGQVDRMVAEYTMFRSGLVPIPDPPTNSFCDSAIRVQKEAETVGSTLYSAVSDDVTLCGFNLGSKYRGLWYTFLGTGERLQATTCNGTTYDTQLTVFEGSSCDHLTCITGNDDHATGNENSPSDCPRTRSLIEWEAENNALYYIYVHGWENSVGNFTLIISDAEDPPPTSTSIDIGLSLGISVFLLSIHLASAIGVVIAVLLVLFI